MVHIIADNKNRETAYFSKLFPYSKILLPGLKYYKFVAELLRDKIPPAYNQAFPYEESV